MQAPPEQSPVRRAYEGLRQAALASPFPDAEVREDRLERVERLLAKHEEAFVRAISEDFGFRARAETVISEIFLTVDAAREARRCLREWMRRREVSTNPFFIPSQAWVEYLPLGVVGIISPWNYPVNMALSPAVGALAAGNRVLLKPSEYAPRTSELLAAAVAEFFAPDELTVVLGHGDVAAEVTALPLDHLLFTGSTRIGHLVARQASEHLTRVTLELGGKSPVLVSPGYSVARAAERVAVGKTFNAGQSCIAPDYVLLPRGTEAAFVDAFRAALARAFPGGREYTSVHSDRAMDRLAGLLADAKARGATAVETMAAPAEGRFLAPVLLLGVTDEMQVMQEEIFGPLLPIETYETMDEAIARIQRRPRPLAFYYFDDDADRTDDVLRRVVSGGACVNDTMVHFAQENLPFGGVGLSGQGAYHGRAGFETFSHARGVMVSSSVSPARRFLNPPFSGLVNQTLNFLIRGFKKKGA